MALDLVEVEALPSAAALKVVLDKEIACMHANQIERLLVDHVL
jgi:hypothetical protein